MERTTECARLFAQIPPQTPLYFLPQFNDQQMPQNDNVRWFFTREGLTDCASREVISEAFEESASRLQQVSAGKMQKVCDPHSIYLLIRSFADIHLFICEIEVFRQLYSQVRHAS